MDLDEPCGELHRVEMFHQLCQPRAERGTAVGGDDQVRDRPGRVARQPGSLDARDQKVAAELPVQPPRARAVLLKPFHDLSEELIECFGVRGELNAPRVDRVDVQLWAGARPVRERERPRLFRPVLVVEAQRPRGRAGTRATAPPPVVNRDAPFGRLVRVARSQLAGRRIPEPVRRPRPSANRPSCSSLSSTGRTISSGRKPASNRPDTSAGSPPRRALLRIDRKRP